MFAIFVALMAAVAVDVRGVERHRKDTFKVSRLGLTPVAAWTTRKARKTELREEARKEIETAMMARQVDSPDFTPMEGWVSRTNYNPVPVTYTTGR